MENEVGAVRSTRTRNRNHTCYLNTWKWETTSDIYMETSE
jgi:hypothetical protein